MDNKKHWENIYQKKEIDGVSWYQKIPLESLQLIKKYSISNYDKIIDIGCGKSFLADNLLELNYTNISLVDISSNALKEVNERLQNKSLNFIEIDILNFNSNDKYDIWHDRAVFHFITDREGIKKYISLCNEYINKEGILIIGTFAEDGPLKCSGLEIKRYSVDQISDLFEESFELVESFKMLHKTPFDTEQSFSFCVLRKFTDH
ncbi:MAG: SAM-dependent methyltransferase [Flavobacteriaceae bacterium]|jgi:2-polyprenyl-3-methyl-5-hydroxy-6-metoxy-1,4-benzoquinol methylase|nr:SAM-dependent methyltransferase [Flavobacteriaceae bacterium]|tara:strand:- start:1007 stop:1621 length:615 start_codon:yes stop_codon:yes gene_type:complete